MTDADWIRRAELDDLLRVLRRRLRRAAPGGRSRGLRQEDAASLAGLSRRRYADLEHGAFSPSPEVADRVAAGLQMTEAERSALHVLATGQDPPRRIGQLGGLPPQEPNLGLRALVTHMDPFPAALTDESWTLLFRNTAMDKWAGGWFLTVPPDRQNLILYLFSDHAEQHLPDIHALRSYCTALLRYQYDRNLASAKFADLVRNLIGTGAEAAELWARHEVEFAPHQYPVRLRHGAGTADASVLFTPVTPQLWLFAMVIPAGISPPRSRQGDRRLPGGPAGLASSRTRDYRLLTGDRRCR
jgi:transcriptional regulator with XRE-family HTH domain